MCFADEIMSNIEVDVCGKLCMALWWNLSNSIVILEARSSLVSIRMVVLFDYPDSCLMGFN